MSGLRCSDAARLRDDPRIGTAPPARRWLLIEQEVGWSPQAFDGMPLEEHVRSRVTRAAQQARARILLVRRPARRALSRPEAPGTEVVTRSVAPRAWCVVDPGAARPVTWGSWGQDAELTGAADVLVRQATDLTRAAGDPPPVRAPAAEPELLLVCTHGRKDVCCAVRGRPVAAALAARWPEATWECSHTGGDRFAANVVVLPGGVVYGGVDPDTAVDTVAAHHEGAPPTARLRGVAGHAPAVQAAIAAAHTRLGPLPWGSVHPLGMSSTEGHHTVTLGVGGRTVQVDVREELREAHQLTCSAVRPGQAAVPVVVGLRVVDP